MPTCLELAGGKYPESYKGNKIKPLEGRSLMPYIKGEKKYRDELIFFEHEGNGAARQGKWKLVHRGNGPWELYDMSKDSTEMHNLAKVMPEKLSEMTKAWNEWAAKNGVRTGGKAKKKKKK